MFLQAINGTLTIQNGTLRYKIHEQANRTKET